MDPRDLLAQLERRSLRLASLNDLRAAFGPGGAVEKHLASSAEHQPVVVAWRGHLLDVRDFAALHPGGASVLRQMRGRDVTSSFDKMNHSESACGVAMGLVCGEIVGEASSSPPQQAPHSTTTAPTTSTTGVPQLVTPASDDDVVLRAIEQRDAATAAMEDKLRARTATKDLRGYGSRWHDDRRRRIFEAHRTLISQLLEEHSHFPLTLVIGVVAAMLHFTIATSWIPTLCIKLFRPFSAISAAAATAASRRGVFSVIYDHISPISILASFASGSGDHVWCWFVAIVGVFFYAYFFGAFCKMVAFGVGHELCHETVHPLVSVGLQPFSTVVAQAKDWREVASYCLRFALKDVSLRVCTLPSVDHTIFEYYHNQHLAHHRFLGAQDISDALTGLINGTNTGDGDQMAIVGLQMHQRQTVTVAQRITIRVDPGVDGEETENAMGAMTRKVEEMLQHRGGVTSPPPTALCDDASGVAEQGTLSDPIVDDFSDDEDSGRRLAAQRISATVAQRRGVAGVAVRTLHFIVKRTETSFRGLNWDSITSGSSSVSDGDNGLHRFFRWISKHRTVGKLLLDPVVHLGHWFLTNMTALVHLGALSVFVPVLFVSALPQRLYPTVERFVISPLLGSGKAPRSSLRAVIPAIWPLASVGVQCVLKIALLVAIYFRITDTMSSAKTSVSAEAVFVLTLLYLSLSELFCFGFLFHPFLAYFLTVHHSAFDHSDPHIAATAEAVGNPTSPPLRSRDRSRIATLQGSAAGKDSGEGSCQPTRSMYGSNWFSLCTMFLTRHVEHHDFPSVPWWYLPTITKIAPEFYAPGSRAGGARTGIFAVNDGPFQVIRDYLLHEPRHTVYGCSSCT